MKAKLRYVAPFRETYLCASAMKSLSQTIHPIYQRYTGASIGTGETVEIVSLQRCVIRISAEKLERCAFLTVGYTLWEFIVHYVHFPNEHATPEA